MFYYLFNLRHLSSISDVDDQESLIQAALLTKLIEIDQVV